MKNTFKITRNLNKIVIVAQMPDIENFFKNIAIDRHDTYGNSSQIGPRYFYNIGNYNPPMQHNENDESPRLYPQLSYPAHNHFIHDRQIYCNFLTAVGLSEEARYTYQGVYSDEDLKFAFELIKSIVKNIIDSTRPLELNFEVEDTVTPLVETL